MKTPARKIYDGFCLWSERLYFRLYHRSRLIKSSFAAKSYKGFYRDFRKLAIPYWKNFGVLPGVGTWRVLCGSHSRLDPRYIPNPIWYGKIIPHFNDTLFTRALEDKCLQGVLFPDVKQPDTVLTNISGIFRNSHRHPVNETEAIELCRAEGGLIAKPSVDTGHGRDIQIFTGKELDPEDIRKLFSSLGSRDFIVQRLVRQHRELDALGGGSVNTIRIITFFYKGKARVLSAVLRMGGNKNGIDNIAAGGCACRILPGGRLAKSGVSRKDGWTETSPGGIRFEDTVVPRYDVLIKTAKKAAENTGHFRIIGWDFAIDLYGEPVLIEYNTIPEPNQVTCGPTFGELTEEVLREVYEC